MKSSNFYSKNFTNRFACLPEGFHETIKPQAIAQAKIVSINEALADTLGLSQDDVSNPDFLAILGCEAFPENACSLATVYSGHQFGQYNPQLGDGRALLIGEIETDNGFTELQIKGSGLTPFSRMGDGRAVLRSTIREYLGQEAMYGLGIPTTRSLAMATSTTPVYRETVETAATLIRTAESFIRFGHFEYFFYTKQTENLQTLADFVIDHYFPEAKTTSTPYADFFLEVVKRTAKLIAKWQAVGFCHGVMNTDNLSILGLTLDYGPFAFMDDFDLHHICNHSDTTGRYAFNQQINIGLWNLNALAHSLSPFIDEENLRFALSQYESTFHAQYQALMAKKLGLTEWATTDSKAFSQHLGQLLSQLHNTRVDYTLFFRELSQGTHQQIDFSPFSEWMAIYKQHTDASPEREMIRVNPKYILRNHLAQQAIDAAKKDDFTLVNDLLHVLQSPFDEHEAFEHFAKPPEPKDKHIPISCSS
ncbi:MAG: YdiU family protein [Cellvibrionales bacterium]|nr:YdiU family protein [Cellvibrionales bacterium]